MLGKKKLGLKEKLGHKKNWVQTNFGSGIFFENILCPEKLFVVLVKKNVGMENFWSTKIVVKKILAKKNLGAKYFVFKNM